ncbi:MAG: DUF1846 domain-containing protein [Candidatus Omnitrophica bacterium]|nr:DUF1846 domain-containing protein [Candidatus Omnitrophota bacterium]MBU4303949.1 DUF1846 domain-containing protein [Candidatus Omnitrophota bacterium]MBU4467834.1 DUF1846 domain-containing protein [Candidatus Omnitrophota bacterium]MCG2707053.1 DUF1846 domain-containing protein [Candidatus Omnitrophota bacterium]
MIKKTGFDNEKYLKEQTAAILDRVKSFDNKLYLEFGGKLCFDYHAARVLPGYDPNVKIRLLQCLKDKIDIVLSIYAADIEKGRVRGDFGITYDEATLKLIDDLRKWGLDILAVVITRFAHQPSATIFKNKLERRGIKVYLHYPISGYPVDVDAIVSENGFGKNDYIQTKNPIVVVTAPGPNSGKLSTCLSQLFHEHKHGINAGYAKFETFPIWNLPLRHPVNVAYEAATADIQDFNLIDPFHLDKYAQPAVNYNRDVESFPILKLMLSRIFTKNYNFPTYNSPTDMGVNRAGFGIIDDLAVQEAAKQELIRRYFRYNSEYILGIEKKETVERVVLLMEEMEVKVTDRLVVEIARKAAQDAEKQDKGHDGVFCGAAIQLGSGEMITGKNSKLMHAASSLVMNAIKVLARIPDEILLLSPHIINQIAKLKKDILKADSENLDLEECLIALSISAATSHTAELAMQKLGLLRGCEVHMTHIPTPGDEVGLKRLGVNLTTDGKFSSRNLFVT